jgi:hypothetical protein
VTRPLTRSGARLDQALRNRRLFVIQSALTSAWSAPLCSRKRASVVVEIAKSHGVAAQGGVGNRVRGRHHQIYRRESTVIYVLDALGSLSDTDNDGSRRIELRNCRHPDPPVLQ